jgi:nitroreductase
LNGPIGRRMNQTMLSFAAGNVVVERLFVQLARTFRRDERRFAAMCPVTGAAIEAFARCCTAAAPLGLESVWRSIVSLRRWSR